MRRDVLSRAYSKWHADIKVFRKTPEVWGVEKWFDLLLLWLRFGSFSYWMKEYIAAADSLSSSPNKQNRKKRQDIAVEKYILIQLTALCVWFVNIYAGVLVAIYVWYELFLNLFAIVFIAKGIGLKNDIDESVAEKSSSSERSLLLALVNMIQIVWVFAIFYKTNDSGLSYAEALFSSALVFATIGHPGDAYWLVMFQIFFGFAFIAVFLSRLAGQVGLAAHPDKKKKEETSDHH